MASARNVALHVDEIVDDGELEALMGKLAIDMGKPFRRETGKSVASIGCQVILDSGRSISALPPNTDLREPNTSSKASPKRAKVSPPISVSATF